mgnify:CR=1 FL=1
MFKQCGSVCSLTFMFMSVVMSGCGAGDKVAQMGTSPTTQESVRASDAEPSGKGESKPSEATPKAGNAAPDTAASGAGGEHARATAGDSSRAPDESASGGAGGNGADKKGPHAASAGDAADTPCDEGQKRIGGKCACDLNGIFAVQEKVVASVSGVPGAEGFSASSYVWSLLRSKAEGGKLKLALQMCGQQVPDTCSAAVPLLQTQAEAHGEYVPASVWSKLMPTEMEVQLADPAPGASFETPLAAGVQGSRLSEPRGAWPGSRKDVEGSDDFDGSATNGARWNDLDNDGKPGVTISVVPPGGVAAGGAAAPFTEYGATSPDCPKGDDKAPRSPYAYLPVSYKGAVVRVKQLYTAQRLPAQFQGKLDSCNKITGKLLGASGEDLTSETLLAGCTIADGADDKPCPAELVDMLSQSSSTLPPGLKLSTKGRFVLLRVPDSTSCADVRSQTFE